MMKLRDRVKNLIHVKPAQLVSNPYNFRTHDEKQRSAFRGILSEVGIAGAQVVRELGNDKYEIIDGHMRKDEFPADQFVPVLVLDVTEEEANKLLASYDPISALAGKNKKALASLLKSIDTKDEALATLFSELADNGKLLDPKELELDLEEDDEDDEESKPLNPKDIPLSHVRMVQLFLSSETLPIFDRYLSLLGPELGTTNSTATVIESLKKLVELLGLGE
jgi:ParB-like chromosome segregation protein Spo0J